MKNQSALALAFALTSTLAAASVGCVAHAQADGYTEAEAPVAFSEPPTLVEVDSDVWVVSDYDYPVYYVGDTYWVYRDDVWYRSPSYDRGWARVEVGVVPSVIVRRDPRVYVHYHGAAAARTRVAARAQGGADVARPEQRQRAEPQRAQPQREEPQRAEPQRAEPQRTEPQRTEPQRAEPQRTEPQRAEPQRGTEHRAEEPRGATPAPDQKPATSRGHGGAPSGKKRGK